METKEKPPNRKHRRHMSRMSQRMNKTRWKNYGNVEYKLLEPTIPHNVHYISFTSTLKYFYENFIPHKHTNKAPMLTADVQKHCMANIGMFFSKNAHFFFGCKPQHLQLDSVLKNKKRVQKLDGTMVRNHFRDRLRVPYELSMLGHPQLTPVAPCHALTYKSLPKQVASAWNIFSGALIKAMDDKRIYFFDETKAHPQWHHYIGKIDVQNGDRRDIWTNTCKNVDNYEDLKRFLLGLAPFGRCAVVYNGEVDFSSDSVWDNFEFYHERIRKRKWRKSIRRVETWKKVKTLAALDYLGPDWNKNFKKLKSEELRTIKRKMIEEQGLQYAKRKLQSVKVSE